MTNKDCRSKKGLKVKKSIKIGKTNLYDLKHKVKMETSSKKSKSLERGIR